MIDVLFLTNNTNAYPLYKWLCEKVKVELWEDALTLEILEEKRPRIVISYNYDIIVPAECIVYMRGRIINMHISLLPWNRGESPNLWSFIEDTPKGVTIHEMSTGLDKGKIIFQEKMYFDAESETLASSYEKLNAKIVEIFKLHWEELLEGCYETKEQVGKGSYHSKKDLQELKEKISFSWDEKIAIVLKRIDTFKEESNRK